MSVSSTATPSHAFAGDGVTVAFNLPFVFFDADDLEVTERVIATGVETLKTLTTHYTVSGGNGAAGVVTAVSAPAATVQWIVRRRSVQEQSADSTGAGFLDATIEQVLDRLVLMAQENRFAADRALRFPPGDPAALVATLPSSVDRASRLAAYDASGNPIALLASAVNLALVSAFGESLINQADANAVRALLGVPMVYAVMGRSAGADQAGFGDAAWTKALLNYAPIDPYARVDAANSKYVPGIIGTTLAIGRVAWTSPEAGGTLGTHLGKNDALYTTAGGAAQGPAAGTYSGQLVAGVIAHNATDSLCLFGLQDSPTAGYARTMNGANSQTYLILLTFAKTG